MNSDFRELLSLFKRHQVRYLVAGGYAVMYYTDPRYTKDLDIVVGTSSGEVNKVAEALSEFGYPMTDAQIAQLGRPNQMIVLGVPPSRIDILNELSGVNFDEAWARRTTAQVAAEAVDFICLQDLIAAKRAAGRPQDLLDLAKLERLANEET